MFMAVLAMDCAAQTQASEPPTVSAPQVETTTSSSLPTSPQATSKAPVQAAITPPHETAEEQIRREEKQRILGVLPNFNVVDLNDAVPLSRKQKFHLMYKSSTDPVVLGTAAMYGAIGQADNSFEGYGQGWEGYGKRIGATLADNVDGNFWGNAIFPILLHQDPRYFRKGTGTFKARLLYSVATTVRTRSDSGHWMPNYSNIAGNLVAGGISNLYYPSTDRGIGLTFQSALNVTAEGALGSLFVEFWPNISHKLFKKKEQIAALPHDTVP